MAKACTAPTKRSEESACSTAWINFSPWLLVICCWLLVVGCWLLVVGCWLLVVVFLLTTNKSRAVSLCVDTLVRRVGEAFLVIINH
ncbi:MAG TPA: hypothetical protein DEG47_12430 [Cyanobacteria bacterium UBA11148]|nr:hypothetical protein [Cyanobacteria bacterium UBA11148]